MTKIIKISDIELNNGQIDGLPKNPRFIRDNQFESLKQSLRDFPEMLNLRELIVYPHDGKYIVIAGNMRFRAGKELGMTEFPCKVLSKETTIDRLKEITIKDNNSFGEWDYDQLANEWDSNKLGEWGVDLPTYNTTDINVDDFLSNIEKTETVEENFVLSISFPRNVEDKRDEITQKISKALQGYIFKIK